MKVHTRHIAVIGGGPAGLASTLALLACGFRVTVIERSHYRSFRVGEHLAPDAIPLLAQLGVPPTTWEQASLGCPQIRVSWGHATLRETEYLFNPYGESLILSRPAFDAELAEQARRNGATVLTGTRVRQVHRSDSGWDLIAHRASKQETIKADFLIDATGRPAVVARSLGSQPIIHDRLLGIATVVDTTSWNRPVSNSLLIEACEEGWWYSAHVGEGRIVATYMTDRDFLSGFKGNPRAYWQDRLRQSTHTQARLKEHDPISTVHVRSARSQILRRLTGAGWLAVGDAAMSFDPLSSQGIQKGLFWGIQAARAVQSFFEDTSPALARYEDEMRDAFEYYLTMRTAYYRMEQRWPKAPFWQRRHHLG